MTITAKIIADSVAPTGARLSTLELRYPRFIHAEFMTHRVFSRNASSSRAIPVERLIQDILDDTAMPLHWGKNQPGMQAREEHTAGVLIEWDDHIPATAPAAWCRARDRAIDLARAFSDAGYHKQIVNRLLEPFSHINVVVSATDWVNFFALRDHPDAQPEIQALARAMRTAMDTSVPVERDYNEWHLPYVTDDDPIGPISDLKLVSAARCARVSYKTHDGRVPDLHEDLQLALKLLGPPIHASPFEHQGQPYMWGSERQCGNFNGWVQYRKDLERAG